MGAGRRWGLVAGALLVLVGRLGFMLVSTTLRLTLLTCVPSNWVFETARGRFVAARTRDIVVSNDLDDANRISKGVGHYGNLAAEVSTAV